MRLPEPLRAWLVDYALMRRAPVSAVVIAALEDFRDLCAAGVPELPLPSADGRSARVGRVRGAGSRASSSPGAPAASSRPAAGAPASVADVVTGTGPRDEVLRRRKERLDGFRLAAERTGHREGCGCIRCDDVRSGRGKS